MFFYNNYSLLIRILLDDQDTFEMYKNNKYKDFPKILYHKDEPIK